LSKCERNTNFPLSLNKVTKDRKLRTVDELVYDYPYLRLSGEMLGYELMLDRYAFRVNETSRFFMTLGSH